MPPDLRPIYATAAEANEAASEKFNSEAVDWVNSAVCISKFYIQPYPPTLGVMVLGSGGALLNFKSQHVAGSKVEGSFLITKELAMQLSGYLQKSFGITEQEMAAYVATIPPGFGVPVDDTKKGAL